MLTQFPPATPGWMGKEGRNIKSKKTWDQEKNKNCLISKGEVKQCRETKVMQRQSVTTSHR